ncbi:hypothetical protein [Flaviaesturariibacter flavus]|uniref:hypothetical protein n=1 Tax=Flaviaesturariibacter flavus TaxID=2502780 RepID=UPI0014052E1A|nr:hypothetical protein [Flaviaesturariibacter flavus]
MRNTKNLSLKIRPRTLVVYSNKHNNNFSLPTDPTTTTITITGTGLPPVLFQQKLPK